MLNDFLMEMMSGEKLCVSLGAHQCYYCCRLLLCDKRADQIDQNGQQQLKLNLVFLRYFVSMLFDLRARAKIKENLSISLRYSASSSYSSQEEMRIIDIFPIIIRYGICGYYLY